MSADRRPYQSERGKWLAKRDRKRRAAWPRISITLSPKALEIVDYVRDVNESSVSPVIDSLILRTEPQELRIKSVNGLPVFDCEDDGPLITTEDVNRILAEEGLFPRKQQQPTPRKTSVAISPEAIAIVSRFRRIHEVSKPIAICKLIEMFD